MSDSETLRANVGAIDPLLFSAISLFSPQSHSAYSSIARDERTIDPTTGTIAFGNTVTFLVDKMADCVEDIILKLQVGVLTVATSTYRRWVDGLGYFAIDRLAVSYISNQIEDVDPYYMYYRHQQYLQDEAFRAWNQATWTNLSLAEQNAKSAAGGVLYVPLSFYWQFMRSHSPLISGLSNQIKITLTFKPITQLVNHDGGTNVPVSTPALTGALIADLINLTGPERDMRINLQAAPEGVNYLINYIQKQEETIGAGVTTVQHRLANFNTATAEIFTSALQATPNATDGTANYTTQFPFGAPQTFSITAGNLNIIRQRDALLQQLIWNPKFHTAGIARELAVNHAEMPEVFNAADNSFNYGSFSNAVWRMDFPAATSAAQKITYFAITHNFVQHQGGDLQTVFK